MKLILPLLAIMMSVAGCQKDKPVESTVERPQNPAARIAPAVAPPDHNTVPFLMRNYWVIERCIAPRDGSLGVRMIGTWWKMEPDGTYTRGQWDIKKDEGHWFFKEGSKRGLLYTDSGVDDRYDAEIELQGFSTDTYEMSWVKTDSLGDFQPLLMKMINLSSPPTPEQFGM